MHSNYWTLFQRGVAEFRILGHLPWISPESGKQIPHHSKGTSVKLLTGCWSCQSPGGSEGWYRSLSNHSRFSMLWDWKLFRFGCISLSVGPALSAARDSTDPSSELPSLWSFVYRMGEEFPEGLWDGDDPRKWGRKAAHQPTDPLLYGSLWKGSL